MTDPFHQLLDLPDQASTVAADIDHLHYFVIATTMFGAFAVAAVTIYFIVKYRERATPRPRARGPAMSVRFELGLFGGLLALFVLWWVIGFRQYVRIAEPPADALPIYVTGKQWMWSFAYPNGGGSNGVLYVPANRPVKLILTSRDVIHSFFVPAFRVKRDAVPGRSTTMWFEATRPGRYQVLCAEYCGTGHSTMRAEVVVLVEADYARAVAGLAPVELAGERAGSLAAAGARVAANAGCLRCHTVDGTPHLGPTWAGLYDARIPLADGSTTVADEAYLTRSMMDPAVDLHLGFAPIMPTYQGVLSAAEVGAIVEYIRSLRDAPVATDTPLPTSGDAPIPLVQPPEASR